MYYPERLQQVNKEECDQFNARIMKNLMKQKMGKNQTFYQSRMVQANTRASQNIVNVNTVG